MIGLFLLLSVCMPLIAAFFDNEAFLFLPFGFLLALFFCFLPFIQLNVSRLFVVVLALVGFCTLYSLLLGKGVGSGGISILLIETLILVALINRDRAKLIHRVNHKLTRCYWILFFFLILEIAILLSGGIFYLDQLFGNAVTVTKYKTYNTGWLLQELFEINGPNSLLLGSQSASQIALFATIIFITLKFTKKRRLWFIGFVVCGVVYALCATMTSHLVLITTNTYIRFQTQSLFL